MGTKATYAVMTANPELLPQVAVYEIERGVFDTLEAASGLAHELQAMGEASQTVKRQWVCVSRDIMWLPGH